MDKDTAREMTRKILAKWYDPESVTETLKEDFYTAYDSADEEPWWREKYFGNVD